jgi:ubiquinone/menaquinone biosynthesis C-methylase UbiE
MEEASGVRRERDSGPWKLLSFPRVYSRLQNGLAVRGARAEIASRYIRARTGDSVLDIGCGPADILHYLPQVNYVGADLNANYLSNARRRFSAAQPHARFVRVDVRSLPSDWVSCFDLVLAQGLLHHFSDEQVLAMLRVAAIAMKPAARLITVDPAFTPEQGAIARLLIAYDRGRFVRSTDAYGDLARQVFAGVELHVRHDLMRLPYTHLIMECSDAIA